MAATPAELSGAAGALSATRSWRDPTTLRYALAAVIGAVIVGLMVPSVSGKFAAVPVWLACVALVLLTAGLYLAFAKPVVLLVISFLLLPVVRVEPAPVDALFAMLVLVSLLRPNARFSVPVVVAVPLVLFVAVSLLSMTNATAPTRAARYELITLYLVFFGVWLTSVLTDRRTIQLAMKAFVAGA